MVSLILLSLSVAGGGYMYGKMFHTGELGKRRINPFHYIMFVLYALLLALLLYVGGFWFFIIVTVMGAGGVFLGWKTTEAGSYNADDEPHEKKQELRIPVSVLIRKDTTEPDSTVLDGGDDDNAKRLSDLVDSGTLEPIEGTVKNRDEGDPALTTEEVKSIFDDATIGNTSKGE